jgi:hypothetical protein
MYCARVLPPRASRGAAYGHDEDAAGSSAMGLADAEGEPMTATAAAVPSATASLMVFMMRLLC